MASSCRCAAGTCWFCHWRFWLGIPGGLMRSPILVALLATGLIWYMAWAAVRWQAEPFVRQMARESGNPGVQATYGLPDAGAKGSSFTALQDYRQ